MSLNWSTKKIEKSDELYIPGKADPMGGSFKPVKPGTQEPGKEFLNPITNALIWACMAIDIGEIKKSNVEEFWFRLTIWQRIVGPSIEFRWGKESKFLTFADIKRHVGLSTNVYTDSLAAIMSASVAFRENKKTVEFREMVRQYGFYEHNPEGAFKESGTMVNTITVVLCKPAAHVEID